MTKSVPSIRQLGLLAGGILYAQPAAAAPILGTTEGQTVMIIASALLAVFAGIGIYMIYSGIRSRAIARASETWPTTGGTVLASEVEERAVRHRKSNTMTYYYEPKVHYTYKVGGTSYESSVIRFGDLVRNSKKLPDEIRARYPAGATVAVRYDPADPSRATLETESAGGRQILSGTVFILASLFIVAVAWAIIGFSSGGPDLPPEVIEQLNKPN